MIIASSIIGLTIFIGLTIIIGVIFNEGYIAQELKQLGHQVIEEAEQDHSNPDQIIDLLERTVIEHPQLDLEWVSQKGSLMYATNGRTQNYDFNEMIQQFLDMPNSIWEPGVDITLVFTWGQEQDPQYLIMNIPDEAMQGLTYPYHRPRSRNS